MRPLNAVGTKPSSASPPIEVDYDRDITQLYSCITSEDWDGAHDAVRLAPAEARTWVVRYEENGRDVKWRFLPIHSACARCPPSDLIKALLRAYPEGASCEDDQGMWPLHYACGNQADVDVIRFLLESYPEGAKMTDPSGMLPLHYLAKWGPSDPSAVAVLLASYGDAVHSVAYEEGEDGEVRNVTPLELAEEGEYDDKDEVVRILTKHSASIASTASTSASAASSDGGVIKQVESSDDPAGASTNDDDDTVTDENVQQQKAQQQCTAAPTTSTTTSPLKTTKTAHVTRHVPGTSTTIAFTPTTAATTPKHRSKSPAADLGNKTTIAKLVAQLESTRRELLQAKRDATEMRESRRSHEAFVESVEGRLAAKDAEIAEFQLSTEREISKLQAEKEDIIAERDAELAEAKEEVKRLEAELADVTARHDALMEKADDLNGHIIALTSSVASLRVDHEAVAAGLAERKERDRIAAQRRQRLLRELIDHEEELAMLAEANHEGDGLGGGGVGEEEGGEGIRFGGDVIAAALARQKEEMEAVAAILEAVNEKEELLSLSMSCS